jgi:gliding motility-associated-like protein
MRKILHSFTMLLFACGLLMGSAQEARATHLLGGDMTYESLGNNQYRVKLRIYRDCSGQAQTGPFELSCKNGGCSTAASVTSPFVQQGAIEPGNPFCAAVSAGPCQGPAGLPNYDVRTFFTTVTLPPGQWILSTFSNARPALANIASGDLYVEATLNNTNQGSTAVANNSPQFDAQDIPIQYVCWKQRQTITFSSTEADGDSLVYSLAAPLVSCGTAAAYNSQPGSGPVLTAINCPGGGTGFFSFPGLPSSQYTANSPIRLGLDTVGTCPLRTGVARTFNFNQQSRTITFTPGYFDATAGPADGANKYQIAVLITEYRRINGVRRVIGTVRREANIIVINCGSNSTPNPVQANAVTTNSNTTTVNTTDTTRIDVRSCNYSRVELNFTDPDNVRVPSANQLLTVTLPPNINTDPRYLDSGDVGTFSLSGNGTTNPKGVFFFQPSPTTVGRTILLSFKIEDNACPIKGVQNRVLVIRVLRGNFATAAATVGSPGIGAQTPASICPGGSITIQGNVLRPDSIRRIANNTTVLQPYSFQWSVAAGGTGLPAVTNTQNITVNPTATTRYLLRITPQLGFAQGLCGDTSSIVVRVVPQPITTITPSQTAVCAGAEVTLTAATTRPAGPGSNLLDSYTYRWSGPGVQANSTGATLTVRPTVAGANTYTVTVNGASPYGCTTTSTVAVTVVPPPVVTARLSKSIQQQVCPGASVVLKASAVRPTGAGSTLPDTYTYTWRGPGLAASASGDSIAVNPTTLGANVYTVTATGQSQFNCSSTSTITVTVVPPPVVTSVANLTQVCAGSPVLLTADAVRPTGTGSTLPDTYTYRWSGPGVPANATGKTFTVNPTALGVNTYTVTATGQSQFNCSNTSTVTVTVVPPPTITVSNAIACPGGTATLTAMATPATNFNDVYTYTWTGGNLPAGTTGATITVRPTGSTTYTVTATGRAQTGCAVTRTVLVETPPALAVDFEASDALDANNRPTSKPPVIFNFKNTTNVANQVTGSTYSYVWTYQRIADIAGNSVSLETPTTFSTASTPAPLTLQVSGTYRIRLTGNANLSGGTCASNFKEFEVIVPDLQVPNIITPNGDTYNDVFRVSNADTRSKLEIYNRWGRKVYEQSNYANNWGGDNQPAGVYYYLLTDSNGVQTKGWIEVVR